MIDRVPGIPKPPAGAPPDTPPAVPPALAPGGSRRAGRRRLRAALPRLAVALALGLGLALVQASPFGQWFERHIGLVSLYWLRGPVQAPPGAVILALDDAGAEWVGMHAERPERVSPSLARCLRPQDRAALSFITNVDGLTRSFYACVVERLRARGVRTAAFDIVFRRSKDGDARLAAALAAGPPSTVLVGFDTIGSGAVLRREVPVAAVASATAPAFFVVATDSSEMVLGYRRRVPWGDPLPPLPEAARALAEGRAATPAEADGLAPFWLYGPAGSLPRLSLPELFAEPAAGSDPLADAVVFVGLSELDRPGTSDQFRTPIRGAAIDAIAGVELAGTAYLNALHGDRLIQAGQAMVPAAAGTSAMWLNGTMTVLIGAFAAGVAGRGGGWRGAGLLLGGALVLGALSAWLFAVAQLWLPVAVPVVVLPMTAAVVLAGGFARLRRQVTRRLVAPVAANLLAGGGAPHPLEQRPAVVMFADLRDSVEMSEALGGAIWSRRLPAFQGGVAEAVHEAGGIAVEIEGDAMLAIFPADPALAAAPEALDGPAAAACALAAALVEAAMREATAHPETHSLAATLPVVVCGQALGLVSEIAPDGPTATTAAMAPAFRLRIGLDAGAVSMGETEGGGRYAFRVFGRAVHVAKRLQDLARGMVADDPAASIAVVTSSVARAAERGGYPGAMVPLGQVRLKGIAVPHLAYRLR
ncbi:MAG: CHASE2 domain-containing protein [Pseudomonadota bacterium]